MFYKNDSKYVKTTNRRKDLEELRRGVGRRPAERVEMLGPILSIRFGRNLRIRCIRVKYKFIGYVNINFYSFLMQYYVEYF
jgi:hypothetical protein